MWGWFIGVAMVVGFAWALGVERDAATDDFLLLPDEPPGQGLRTRAYQIYDHGTPSEKKAFAMALRHAGYDTVAKHFEG